VRLLAAFKGLALGLQDIDTQHKPDCFLAMNPAGTVPVLDDSGEIVCGSDEIVRHLSALNPSQGNIDLESDAAWKWHDYANHVLGDGTKQWVFQHRDRSPGDLDHALMARCEANWLVSLAFIESKIDEGGWLAGSQPSLADCAVFPRLALGLRYGLPCLDAYPRLQAWYESLARSEVGVVASAWVTPQ
jgi:glutathione S-transferase